MTIDNTGIVDAIGVDKISGELILTIFDHLPWEDNEHLFLLQEKLNTYLKFIESGELLRTYPDANGRTVAIDVICKFAADGKAQEFFNVATPILKNSGFLLRYKLG